MMNSVSGAVAPPQNESISEMWSSIMDSFGVSADEVSGLFNPHAEQAHTLTRNWANDYGLLGNSDRQQLFDRLGYTHLLAYGCTTAPLERLALFSQWFTYYFLLDDQQDLAVLTGRTEDFVALQEELRHVLRTRGTDGSAPGRDLPAAVAELCRRTTPHVSDEWWSRYVAHAEQVFAAQGQENTYRSSDDFPAPAEFKEVRRRAGAADMVFDIIEACEGTGIPGSIRNDPACCRYADGLNDFTTWTNDVLGVDHDAANRDPNNYVLIRQNSDGLDRRTAIDSVTGEIVELVRDLPRRRDEVRRAARKCSAAEQDRIELALGAWYDWSMYVPIHYLRADGRLSQMDRAQPRQPPAFTEDLL